MAKGITIKSDDNNVTYYPKTVSELVYDNDSEKTVKEDITELKNKDVEIETSITDINSVVSDSAGRIEYLEEFTSDLNTWIDDVEFNTNRFKDDFETSLVYSIPHESVQSCDLLKTVNGAYNWYRNVLEFTDKYSSKIYEIHDRSNRYFRVFINDFSDIASIRDVDLPIISFLDDNENYISSKEVAVANKRWDSVKEMFVKIPDNINKVAVLSPFQLDGVGFFTVEENDTKNIQYLLGQVDSRDKEVLKECQKSDDDIRQIAFPYRIITTLEKEKQLNCLYNKYGRKEYIDVLSLDVYNVTAGAYYEITCTENVEYTDKDFPYITYLNDDETRKGCDLSRITPKQWNELETYIVQIPEDVNKIAIFTHLQPRLIEILNINTVISDIDSDLISVNGEIYKLTNTIKGLRDNFEWLKNNFEDYKENVKQKPLIDKSLFNEVSCTWGEGVITPVRNDYEKFVLSTSSFKLTTSQRRVLKDVPEANLMFGGVYIYDVFLSEVKLQVKSNYFFNNKDKFKETFNDLFLPCFHFTTPKGEPLQFMPYLFWDVVGKQIYKFGVNGVATPIDSNIAELTTDFITNHGNPLYYTLKTTDDGGVDITLETENGYSENVGVLHVGNWNLDLVFADFILFPRLVYENKWSDGFRVSSIKYIDYKYQDYRKYDIGDIAELDENLNIEARPQKCELILNNPSSIHGVSKINWYDWQDSINESYGQLSELIVAGFQQSIDEQSAKIEELKNKISVLEAKHGLDSTKIYCYMEEKGIYLIPDDGGKYTGRKNIESGANRVSIYASSDLKCIHIPKGATIVLSGITGLLLDYAAYSQNHSASDYAIQWGSSTEKHPYFITSFSKLNSANYFTMTDGSVDSLSFTNNTDAEWFIFTAKNKSNTEINVYDYNISYEIVWN